MLIVNYSMKEKAPVEEIYRCFSLKEEVPFQQTETLLYQNKF
ncbi:hypothetical protein [Clostridium formicaceticum]|nr:hypothetical protein [Clostridium formicaceticum]